MVLGLKECLVEGATLCIKSEVILLIMSRPFNAFELKKQENSCIVSIGIPIWKADGFPNYSIFRKVFYVTKIFVVDLVLQNVFLQTEKSVMAFLFNFTMIHRLQEIFYPFFKKKIDLRILMTFIYIYTGNVLGIWIWGCRCILQSSGYQNQRVHIVLEASNQRVQKVMSQRSACSCTPCTSANAFPDI